MKRIQTLAVVATVLLSLAGCGGDSSEETGHVHHEFPAHRPANFKKAVSQIEKRARRLGKYGKRETEGFQRLVDIIDWVPEMAADSDLKKADWETANAAAQRLHAKVTSETLDMRALESVVQEDLATLKALVPAAGVPEPDLHHSHHHHDH